MKVITESIDNYGLIMGMIRKLEIIEVIDQELPAKRDKKIIYAK